MRATCVSHHPVQLILPPIILFVGITLSLTAFLVLRNQESTHARSFVAAQCQRKRILVEDEIRGGITILNALHNTVTLCTSMDETWTIYAAKLINSTSWNIVGAAILQTMGPSDLAAYMARTNITISERAQDGSRRPARLDRPEYLIITQDYPDVDSLGFDYYSDPDRHALVDNARSVRALSLSNPTLSINGSLSTVVFFLPTFNQSRFTGGVAAGYYLISMLPKREDPHDIYLQMFINDIHAYTETGYYQSSVKAREDIVIADKNATLMCGGTVHRSGTPVVTMILTTVTSGILAFLAYWIVGLLQDRRERLIEQMATAENIRMANIREHTARLATESKSTFFASMSHELRTPLNGIMWMVNFLADTKLDAEQAEYAKNLKTTSELLLHIVNDVLDLSKLEAGKMQLEEKIFDIVAFMKDLRGSYNSQATKNNNIYHDEVVMPFTPCFIMGDPTRLRQVLDNLLNNAMKFSHDSVVRICVSVRCNQRLCFIVTDAGIGISEEQVQGLFKPYAQGDASVSRKFGGTGLGLCITKSLVELMGGTIECRSKLGSGSTFQFWVPFRPTNLDNLASSENLPDPTFNGQHILVADDNPLNQRVASKLLKCAGLRVTVVDDGEQVVELFSNGDPKIDCILMDAFMPVVDGYQATKTLRARGCTVPIIACTANAMAGEKEKCHKLGMDGFVSKPILRSVLLRELHRVLMSRK